jgi:hypothetical protein
VACRTLHGRPPRLVYLTGKQSTLGPRPWGLWSKFLQIHPTCKETPLAFTPYLASESSLQEVGQANTRKEPVLSEDLAPVVRFLRRAI